MGGSMGGPNQNTSDEKSCKRGSLGGLPKWRTTKMEDDQHGRRPKWKATKIVHDQNGRRPKCKTTKMEDDQNRRRPKWKVTKMEDNQNGIRPKWVRKLFKTHNLEREFSVRDN